MCTSVPAWASRGGGREMPRTPVRRVGRESASLQALVPWCSSCNRLMGEMVRCAGEVNYFRYYKKLGPIAKLATSYWECRLTKLCLSFMYVSSMVERGRPRSGHGTVLCPAQLPGVSHALATKG